MTRTAAQKKNSQQEGYTMSETTTDVRTTVVADAGLVADVVAILAEQTTLAEHVEVTRNGWTTTVAISGDVPFDLWGSGTQALWRLLSAIAYSSEQDQRNMAAVYADLAVLFGGAR